MDIYFQQYKPASCITHYLTEGCKGRDKQTLGFELEHFIVERDSHAAVPYLVEPDSAAPSVAKVLERLEQYYPEASYEQDIKGNSHLFGLSRDKAAITLEPGAQIEVSIGPTTTVREIENLYLLFRSELDPILDSMGLELLEQGYHPTALARDIPLIPKLRYEHMDGYFSQTGKHGICMMRATASTQVSVDYLSEDDAINKFRIANALGPLLAFITDNSPVFEGEVVGACGRKAEISKSGYTVPKRMARMVCWDDTDPKRCLVARVTFDDDYSFAHYVEDLIESPGIFLPAKDMGIDSEYLGFTTFERALPNEVIDDALVLHILSLFFFDARLKNYLELRQADSMPLEYALAYTALVGGLFYNPKAIDYYTECFTYTDSRSIAFAKSALRKSGYDADVYGRPAKDWLKEMLAFAREALDLEEAAYLAPFEDLVAKQTTIIELLHSCK